MWSGEMRRWRSTEGTGLRGVFLVILSALAVGCDSSPTNGGAQEVDPRVLEAMADAIQDEFRAEMIYERVLEEHGSIRPFYNIIHAEERHSEAIARLYQSRGLEVPGSRWSWDQIPSFPGMEEACQAGVAAEMENAEIYEEFFSLDLPFDVRRVFENNQAASLNNHLPAFQRCS